MFTREMHELSFKFIQECDCERELRKTTFCRYGGIAHPYVQPINQPINKYTSYLISLWYAKAIIGHVANRGISDLNFCLLGNLTDTIIHFIWNIENKT